jgi:hypothetical protein
MSGAGMLLPGVLLYIKGLTVDYCLVISRHVHVCWSKLKWRVLEPDHLKTSVNMYVRLS